MRYVKEKKSFLFEVIRPIKVNDQIISEGTITVYDEEVDNSKIVEKSMRIDTENDAVIVEKGSFIVINEKEALVIDKTKEVINEDLNKVIEERTKVIEDLTVELEKKNLKRIKTMREKKASPIDIAKGQLTGMGRDTNGNKVAKFKTNGGKSFSIQTNTNLPLLHKITDIGDISKDELKGIKKEVIKYIKDYGTKMQKDMLEKIIKEVSTGTAKCPDCGNKYLLATNYCVTCKKKVKKDSDKKDDKKKESTIINITDEVTIGNVILEKGDKIKLIKESVSDKDLVDFYSSIILYGSMDISEALNTYSVAYKSKRSGEKVGELVNNAIAEGYGDFQNMDVVGLVYETILQSARNEIEQKTRIDISDLGINVAANYAATDFEMDIDFSERLIQGLEDAGINVKSLSSVSQFLIDSLN